MKIISSFALASVAIVQGTTLSDPRCEYLVDPLGLDVALKAGPGADGTAQLQMGSGPCHFTCQIP